MKKKWGAVLLVIAPLPVGAVVLGGFWLWRWYVAQDLEDVIMKRFRARVAKWAPQLAAAAAESYPRAIGSERWARTFASIIDRESGGGQFLDPPGPAGLGDGGHGHGLGQVDDRDAKADASDYEKQLAKKRLAHIASGDWTDPEKNLRFCAVEVLRGAWGELDEIDDNDERLAAAVAAYNAGVDNVRRARAAGWPVDQVTTGKNYASDVLAGRGEVALS